MDHRPPSAGWMTASQKRPAVAFVGSMALLGVGAIAGLFVVAGEDRAPAAGSETRKIVESAPPPEPLQMPPVKKVQTTRILVKPAASITDSKPAETAAAPQAERDIAAPDQDDPRWARPATASLTATAPEIGKAEPAVAMDAPKASDVASGANALSDDGPADPTRVAAISTLDALVARPAPSEPQADAPAEPALAVPAPARTVRVGRSVTMRTGPTDKARAILTVPASASVGLIGCKSWCEITYKGNRGFIYKSFLDGQPASNRKQVRKKAPKPTTTASSDLMAPKAAQGLPGVWNTPVRQR